MFTNKQNKPVSSDKMETIIGAGTSIEGNLTASGTIRVDGRVNGEIHTEGDVIIGETGQVTGIVKGRNITIAGRLDGNADAEGVLHLVASSSINGDIVVGSLKVEEGAKYKGNCQMKHERIGQEAELQS
jgi:cytoskeletal protein CcmA (bactofilin family)